MTLQDSLSTIGLQAIFKKLQFDEIYIYSTLDSFTNLCRPVYVFKVVILSAVFGIGRSAANANLLNCSSER